MPYYCVHVSMSGRRSLRWSRPCDRPSEAVAIGQERMVAGEASVAFVVAITDDGREVLHSYTRPHDARRLIGHYEELLAALEDDA